MAWGVTQGDVLWPSPGASPPFPKSSLDTPNEGPMVEPQAWWRGFIQPRCALLLRGMTQGFREAPSGVGLRHARGLSGRASPERWPLSCAPRVQGGMEEHEGERERLGCVAGVGEG